MKIKDVKVYPVRLPMKQDFSISGGSVGDRDSGAPHVYVSVQAEDDSVGWGEARPSPRWSSETEETVTTTIRQYLRPALMGQSIFSHDRIQRAMDAVIKPNLDGGQPIAKAAVDMAIHDLCARQFGVPLSQLWCTAPPEFVRLSCLISTRDPTEAEAKARAAKEAGFSGIDLKIGFGPPVDEELLLAVSEQAKGMFFRVDANQGYTMSDVWKLQTTFQRANVDVLEQPLAAADLLGHQAVRRMLGIPIALDESIWDARMLMQAIRLEACDALVVKVTKLGGLKKAKLCGEIGRAAGLDLLGGGLTESSLGLVASAHLFHHLGIHQPVDLNGPFFLQDDPVLCKPALVDGNVRLPTGPGLGCVIDEEKLAAFAVSSKDLCAGQEGGTH